MDNEITNNTLYEVKVNVLNTELGNKDLTTLGEEIEAYDNLAGKFFEEVCKRYWYIKLVKTLIIFYFVYNSFCYFSLLFLYVF